MGMHVKNSEIIIVAGAGRSGTTWLGNIIAGDEFKILFEPFDYRKIPAIEGLGLRPYFRPHDEYSEWREIIYQIMTGQYNHDWVKDVNIELNLKKCRGVLVKDIRINGILKWMDNNYAIKLLFIVRHPCAVAVSRMQCKWKPEVNAFMQNNQLIEDLDVDVPYLRSLLKSELYSHVIMWCFENAVPLRQFGEALPLFRYECLMTDKEKYVPAMLDLLGLTYDSAREKAISKLSNMSTRNRIDYDSLLNGWKQYISSENANVIYQIVSHFKLSSLYVLG